jgi:hypothetical protein
LKLVGAIGDNDHEVGLRISIDVSADNVARGGGAVPLQLPGDPGEVGDELERLNAGERSIGIDR